MTRPDTSKTHSDLSRHLITPLKRHVKYVRHAWLYLLGTRNLAIKVSGWSSNSSKREGSLYWTHCRADPGTPEDRALTDGDWTTEPEPIFFGASDAAFADDPLTRRSSFGYLFKLFGLPIDWKATRQKSVTKSTTEAELYALSAAGSELLWWRILFDAIAFDPEIKPTLFCDNQQTVGVITKDTESLKTKLRHVEIHKNWVRQEYQAGAIDVQWIQTKEMAADGLTKHLPTQKHQRFIEQLGMEDISGLLAPQPRDLTNDALRVGARWWA